MVFSSRLKADNLGYVEILNYPYISLNGIVFFFFFFYHSHEKIKMKHAEYLSHKI